MDIFKNDEAMSYLVETFSQIRDFDPYLSFMESAKAWAEKATDNAIRADRKNSSEAQRLRNLITGEERQIGELETELQNKKNEALNFQTLLEVYKTEHIPSLNAKNRSKRALRSLKRVQKTEQVRSRRPKPPPKTEQIRSLPTERETLEGKSGGKRSKSVQFLDPTGWKRAENGATPFTFVLLTLPPYQNAAL